MITRWVYKIRVVETSSDIEIFLLSLLILRTEVVVIREVDFLVFIVVSVLQIKPIVDGTIFLVVVFCFLVDTSFVVVLVVVDMLVELLITCSVAISIFTLRISNIADKL